MRGAADVRPRHGAVTLVGLVGRKNRSAGHARISTSVMGAEALALAPRRFDTALSRNCLAYVSEVPIAATQSHGTLPDRPPEYVQAFSLNGQGLREAFMQAGFSDVVLHSVRADRTYPSLADALALLRVFPPLARLLACVPEARREAAWDDIARGFQPFARTDSHKIRLPGERLIVAGTA